MSGGFMLLLVLMKKDKRKQLWLPKKAWPSFIVFGIFGMMGVQFTYFVSNEVRQKVVF